MNQMRDWYARQPRGDDGILLRDAWGNEQEYYRNEQGAYGGAGNYPLLSAIGTTRGREAEEMQMEYLEWQWGLQRGIIEQLQSIMSEFQLSPAEEAEVRSRIHHAMSEMMRIREQTGQRALAQGETEIAKNYEARGLQRSGGPIRDVGRMHGNFAQYMAEARARQPEEEQQRFDEWRGRREQTLMRQANVAQAGLPATQGLAAGLSDVNDRFFRQLEAERSHEEDRLARQMLNNQNRGGGGFMDTLLNMGAFAVGNAIGSPVGGFLAQGLTNLGSSIFNRRQQPRSGPRYRDV